VSLGVTQLPRVAHTHVLGDSLAGMHGMNVERETRSRSGKSVRVTESLTLSGTLGQRGWGQPPEISGDQSARYALR
jgi:hypothetical protein